MHTTLYSISESPLAAGVIWVGTDDGNLQLTRDGGQHWDNVVANVPGIGRKAWVSWGQARAVAAGSAFVAPHPRTFRDKAAHGDATSDWGKSSGALVSA